MEGSAMSEALNPPRLKISAWLKEYGSHDIYSIEGVKEDFEKSTGQKFPSFVKSHTLKETRAAMKARGLGGEISRMLSDSQRVVWGYAMAADFAKHLANADASITIGGRQIMGRGRIFYNAIEYLEKAGL
jgi:hypothetical protein